MISKISLLTIIALVIQTFAIKVQGGKHDNDCHKTNFLDLVGKHNVCVKINNCKLYQVNPMNTAYGCSQCNKGFLLEEDEFGAGICIKSNKPKNCIWKARNPLTHGGKEFCYNCQKNYYVSKNDLKCIPLCKKDKIKKCVYYQENDNGKVVCEGCKSGWTVSECGTKCIEGCSVDNCDSCSIVKGQTYCFQCKKDFIGVYDVSMDVYTKCMTCKEWRCLLLTDKAQQCCLGQKEIKVIVN